MDIDLLTADCLADELFLVNIATFVVLWNFVQNTWAELDIGNRPDAQPVCRSYSD
jgi:hypothetical protein